MKGGQTKGRREKKKKKKQRKKEGKCANDWHSAWTRVGVTGPRARERASERASAFLDFFKKSVRPFVKRRFI